MTPKLIFQKVPFPTHYPLVCNYILPATVAAREGDRNCLLRLHLKIGTKKNLEKHNYYRPPKTMAVFGGSWKKTPELESRRFQVGKRDLACLVSPWTKKNRKWHEMQGCSAGQKFPNPFFPRKKKKCRLLLHFPRARFFFLVFQSAVLREKEFGFIWQRKPGDYSRDRKLVVVAELKLEQKRPLNANDLFSLFFFSMC